MYANLVQEEDACNFKGLNVICMHTINLDNLTESPKACTWLDNMLSWEFSYTQFTIIIFFFKITFRRLSDAYECRLSDA